MTAILRLRTDTHRAVNKTHTQITYFTHTEPPPFSLIQPEISYDASSKFLLAI